MHQSDHRLGFARGFERFVRLYEEGGFPIWGVPAGEFVVAQLERQLAELAGARFFQSGQKYLVYLPPGRETVDASSQEAAQSVTVNLSDSSGVLSVEWFNPRTGEAVQGEGLSGGGARTLVPPFGGDAVLYLQAE